MDIKFYFFMFLTIWMISGIVGYIFYECKHGKLTFITFLYAPILALFYGVFCYHIFRPSKTNTSSFKNSYDSKDDNYDNEINTTMICVSTIVGM